MNTLIKRIAKGILPVVITGMICNVCAPVVCLAAWVNGEWHSFNGTMNPVASNTSNSGITSNSQWNNLNTQSGGALAKGGLTSSGGVTVGGTTYTASGSMPAGSRTPSVPSGNSQGTTQVTTGGKIPLPSGSSVTTNPDGSSTMKVQVDNTGKLSLPGTQTQLSNIDVPAVFGGTKFTEGTTATINWDSAAGTPTADNWKSVSFSDSEGNQFASIDKTSNGHMIGTLQGSYAGNGYISTNGSEYNIENGGDVLKTLKNEDGTNTANKGDAVKFVFTDGVLGQIDVTKAGTGETVSSFLQNGVGPESETVIPGTESPDPKSSGLAEAETPQDTVPVDQTGSPEEPVPTEQSVAGIMVYEKGGDIAIEGAMKVLAGVDGDGTLLDISELQMVQTQDGVFIPDGGMPGMFKAADDPAGGYVHYGNNISLLVQDANGQNRVVGLRDMVQDDANTIVNGLQSQGIELAGADFGSSPIDNYGAGKVTSMISGNLSGDGLMGTEMNALKTGDYGDFLNLTETPGGGIALINNIDDMSQISCGGRTWDQGRMFDAASIAKLQNWYANGGTIGTLADAMAIIDGWAMDPEVPQCSLLGQVFDGGYQQQFGPDATSPIASANVFAN